MGRHRKTFSTKADRLALAQAEHDKYLAKMGINKPSRSKKNLGKGVVEFPNYNSDRLGVPPTSDMIPGGTAAKRDITSDHLWKRGAEETPETIAAVKAKAKRVGPLYNKGGAQYTTDGHDPTKDGRRRT